MKKKYLIFAALAVTFSAKAQWGFSEGPVVDEKPQGSIGKIGNYNLETNKWINAAPAANEPFTLAILVTDAAVISSLSGDARNTLALGQARFEIHGVAGKNIHLIPVDAVPNLYAIDISIEQVFGADAFATQDSIWYLDFNITAASISNPAWEWNKYGYGNIGIGVASPKFANAVVLEGFELAGAALNPAGTAMPGTINSTPTGLVEVIEAGVPFLRHCSIEAVKRN